jgi:Protein of unknown function (DUF4239)
MIGRGTFPGKSRAHSVILPIAHPAHAPARCFSVPLKATLADSNLSGLEDASEQMIARLSQWLDQQSPEALVVYFPLFFVALAWGGIFLIRPFLRLWLRRQPGANDLVSYASAGFTLFHGLLLGLLSVATYQNTKDVGDNISREALGIGTIYRVSNGYPEPLKSELQANLRDYTQYIINKDWPAHRKGVIQLGGEHRLQVMREQLLGFEPTGKSQEILHTEVLKRASSFKATGGGGRLALRGSCGRGRLVPQGGYPPGGRLSRSYLPRPSGRDSQSSHPT